MLTAQFKNDTPAFQGDKAAAIANVLLAISVEVRKGEVAGEIYDGVSKARIGTWVIQEEMEDD